MTEHATIRLPCPQCGAERPVRWTVEEARRFATALLAECDKGGPVDIMPPPPRG